MGNLMNNIKPNYFIGIRTPWALESEENWRMTHYFCSRIWFFGGLLITILIMLLPATFAFFIIIFGSIPLVVTPVLYSYNLFRQKQKKA
jgi:uncharacterized membrane protein